jgi:hypothetical protein
MSTRFPVDNHDDLRCRCHGFGGKYLALIVQRDRCYFIAKAGQQVGKEAMHGNAFFAKSCSINISRCSINNSIVRSIASG